VIVLAVVGTAVGLGFLLGSDSTVSDHRKPRFAIIECRGGAGVLVGGW
jgi:hypothetical protein